MTQNRLAVSLLAGILLWSSCDPSDSEKSRQQDGNAVALGNESVQVIFSRLPHPSVLPAQLERTGTDFDWEFLLLKEYPGSPRDTASAILSGLLTADVAYFIAFDQSGFDSPYFSRLNGLSGEMCRIPKNDIESLNKAFEESVNRRDSLQQLLGSVYMRTTESLQKGNNGDYAILFATSYVIENLFITSSLIDNYPDDMLAEDSRSLIIIPLVRLLLEQESNLEDGIKLIQEIPDTDIGNDLLTHMQTIDGYFDRLSIEEDLRNRRADLVMANSTFKALREEISKTRNVILTGIR